MNGDNFIAVLVGSKSDIPRIQSGIKVLDEVNLKYDLKVLSAHRSPEELGKYIIDADQNGCALYICCAGMAAHLAGAVAAKTNKPVLGVPLEVSLGGLDSLLSTVQMPPGVPVATLGINGIKNAVILAMQILALNNPALLEKINKYKKNK